jgi:hypothetical protein
MNTAKEEVRQLLDRGREAAGQGRGLTQDEVESRTARWLDQ